MARPLAKAPSSPLHRLAGNLRHWVRRVPLATWLALVVSSLIICLAAWYTSAGKFPAFPQIQNDYLELGDAFLHGQTALLESPDPRLADLGNPYDTSQRKHIPIHWDASYYGERYYLYWGPVPALVSAGLEAAAGFVPPASVLLLVGYLSLLVIFSAVLVQVSRNVGVQVPPSSISLFLLFGLVNLPLLNVIGSPRSYQASILYGQAALLLGLLGFLLFVRRRRSHWLLLGGLGWGMALGARYNLLFSVAIYAAFAVLWLWRQGGWEYLRSRAAFLLAPLLMCAIALGIYNYVRFDDVFETGLKYQLTIAELRQQPYALDYIRPNLYLYLLYPLTSSPAFPFMQSAHFHASVLPGFVSLLPGQVIDQIIIGVLPSVPGLWLLFLLPLAFLGSPPAVPSRAPTHQGLEWYSVLALIAAAGVAQLLFLLVFFYTTERYIADFYLSAVLCAAIVVWRIDGGLHGRRLLRVALWLAVGALILWSTAIGYFSCFGVPSLVFNYVDPGLVSKHRLFWESVLATAQGLVP